MILGLEFPPISHVVEWPALLFDGTPFAINKVVILMWLSVIIVFLVFAAARGQKLVPTGAQNVAETAIEFIDDQIVLQTMGPEGLRFTPFLLTLFTFIFTCNIWGLIPGAQMPVNARIALPIFMALLVYVIYNVVGIVRHGPLKYVKDIAFLPGVPKVMYILLTPIELITKFITQALFASTIILAALPLGLLIFLYAFELLVAVLQAYIFTILAAVYIDAAMHPAH